MEVAAILDEVFAASEATPETDLKVAREALVQSAAAHVKAVRRIDELLGGQTGATAE